MATSDKIDVFVELIGGDTGAAEDAVRAAIMAGKHVITANKALLAKHGNELARLAEEHNVSINFEAAVAGGIPVIKAIRGKPDQQRHYPRLRYSERNLQLYPHPHGR